MGWAGYASIIRLTQLRSVSVLDVEAMFKAGKQHARRVLTRLHELGVVHIAEWVRTAKVGAAVPAYRYGSGNDAPRPGGKPGAFDRIATRLHNRLPELTHVVGMLRMISASPITAVALSEECGTSHSNVLPFLRHCRTIGLARVADWEPRRTGPVAMWGLGEGEDAPRPAPKDRREVNAAYMRRIRGVFIPASRLAPGFSWVQA